jgi:hypothetical protein
MRFLYNYCVELKRYPRKDDIDFANHWLAGEEWEHLEKINCANDSSAWALKEMRLALLNRYGKASNNLYAYSGPLARQDLVHWAHTYAQEHPGSDSAVAFVLLRIPPKLELRMEDYAVLFKYGYSPNTAMYLATHGQYSVWSGMVIDYCDPAMLRRKFNLKKVQMLLRDTERPGDYKFKSVNELQEAHDAYVQTVLEEERARTKDRLLSYTPEFENAVTLCGFLLPSRTHDMVARGIEHHNCVANYIGRHISNQGDKAHSLSRILIGEKSTAEILVYYDGAEIWKVLIGQHLGKFNSKNVPSVDWKPLYRLAGRPVSILDVTVTEIEGEGEDGKKLCKANYAGGF